MLEFLSNVLEAVAAAGFFWMFCCVVAINYYAYRIQKNHRRAGCHKSPSQLDICFNQKMLTLEDLPFRDKMIRCFKLMPLGLGVAIVAGLIMWAATSLVE